MPDNIGHTVQLARLVLAKFSYTTTSTLHNVPLNWNHIIGQNDIIAVFEKYHAAVPGGSQSYQKIVLKIAQHSKVLVSRALNAV
jgi:tetrahydromethanopterin S-methyltransferase subunit H